MTKTGKISNKISPLSLVFEFLGASDDCRKINCFLVKLLLGPCGPKPNLLNAKYIYDYVFFVYLIVSFPS